MTYTPLNPEDVTLPKREEPFGPANWPKPWPQQGDRVLHEFSGREGDVLSNNNGAVKIDWGLYVTVVQASELTYVQ